MLMCSVGVVGCGNRQDPGAAGDRDTGRDGDGSPDREGSGNRVCDRRRF